MYAITLFLLGLVPVFAAQAAVVMQEDLLNQPLLEMPRPALTGSDAGNPQLMQALQALEAGQYAEARRLAESQIALNPRSAPAHEILGAALALEDRLPEARKFLERAAQLDPRQWTALMKLGDIDLAIGDRAAAEKRFSAAALVQNDSPQLQQRLGLMAFYAGRFDDAVTHFRKGVVGLAPESVSIRPNLAFIYNQRGQYRQSLELFEGVPLAKVKDAQAYIAVATAMLGLDQLADARKLLADARVQLPKQAGLWLLGGRVARRAGEPVEAVALLTEVLKLAPGNLTAAVELALAEAAAGRLQPGLHRMEALAKAHPKDGRVLLGLAQLYAMVGQQAKAVDVYRGLLEMPALRRFAALGLAQLLSQQGKLADAEVVVRSSLSKGSNDVDLLQQLGSTLAAQGKYKEAVKIYQQALALDPGNAPVLRLLSLAQSGAGDSNGAIKTAERLTALYPDEPAVLLLLGMLQEGAGRQADAQATYQNVLAKDKKNLVAMNNLSLLLLSRGQSSEAAKIATELLKLAPDEPEILDSVGWVFLRTGRVPESRKVLERAVKIATAGPNVWYHYAVLLSESGEKEQASQAARKALELNPTFKYALEAKALAGEK